MAISVIPTFEAPRQAAVPTLADLVDQLSAEQQERRRTALQEQMQAQLFPLQLARAQQELTNARLNTPEQQLRSQLALKSALGEIGGIKTSMAVEAPPEAGGRALTAIPLSDTETAAFESGAAIPAVRQINEGLFVSPVEQAAFRSNAQRQAQAQKRSELEQEEEFDIRKENRAATRAMDQARFQQQLEGSVPVKHEIRVVGNKLFSVNPVTQESRLLQDIPEGNQVVQIPGFGAMVGNPQNPDSFKIIPASISPRKKDEKKTAADEAFETNSGTLRENLNILKKNVQKFGNYESWNPEVSAQYGALPYQIAIQYAKIVDPNSVAREGEVAAAQKYLIPMQESGRWYTLGIPTSVTRDKVTLAAVDNMLRTLESYERNRNLSKGIDSPASSQNAPSAASSTPSTNTAESYLSKFK